MKKTILSILVLVIIYLTTTSSGCSKNKKGCWQALDNLLGHVFKPPICDVTKKEAEEKYPYYMFYPADEPELCWYVTKQGDPNYPQRWWGIPGSLQSTLESRFGVTLNRIDCSSFCYCTWEEKRRSKITGLYSQTWYAYDRFTNADTCSKLYVGRVIIYRETADSIITRELKEKYP